MIVDGSKRALAMCGLLALLTSGCAWMQRVSVDNAGGQAAGGSNSVSISGDGHFVAFHSDAANLVADDTNGTTDVFVRDAVAGTNSLVSVSSAEDQGNGLSVDPAISGDGRYVAFASDASNLVAGDTNGVRDAFVRDTVAGTTSRASVDSSEVEGNNASSSKLAISADGRYVAFRSAASNLVAGDTNGAIDVFVRDTVAGTTSRVSTDSAGAEANDVSGNPAVSADGHYVAFESLATNLVAGDISGNGSDIFVRDTVAGTTTRVSVDGAGTEADARSGGATISADGRYVAFHSLATNLVAGDTNGEFDIFVRDTVAGTTSRISVDSASTQSNGENSLASISADGRYIAWNAKASNLVAGDTNGRPDTFVRDTVAGTTTRVSVRQLGVQATGGPSGVPSISANGRFVAFESTAHNLVSGDSNGRSDIFVRANPEPTVTGITPATLSRGTTTPVTVTGTHFLSGAQLVIDGDGVTVANVNVVNETEITADVTVAADATLSTRNVFVELPGSAPAPAISATGLCVGCVTVN